MIAQQPNTKHNVLETTLGTIAFILLQGEVDDEAATLVEATAQRLRDGDVPSYAELLALHEMLIGVQWQSDVWPDPRRLLAAVVLLPTASDPAFNTDDPDYLPY